MTVISLTAQQFCFSCGEGGGGGMSCVLSFQLEATLSLQMYALCNVELDYYLCSLNNVINRCCLTHPLPSNTTHPLPTPPHIANIVILRLIDELVKTLAAVDIDTILSTHNLILLPP